MYDLNKFLQSLPQRGQMYGQEFINAALHIPSNLITAFILFGLTDRESECGLALSTKGPDGKGDYHDGMYHGYGLTQIDIRAHGDWINANEWQKPEVILPYTALLLSQDQSFLSRPSSGNIEVGPIAANRRGVAPGEYQDPRPITDPVLLQKALISAYNTGDLNVLVSLAVGVDPDTTTTGGNYAADILQRAAKVKSFYDSLP